MPNRLANSLSPYLLQHKDNPVDWFPWGDEAFAKAKEEDKPIFLSVGYSSCHWCHVMEHESFEDEEIASFLGDHFISIKVDREERPDIDEAFMTAVQLSSGRGGWPMSVFLTPLGKPFFAGTYFPKEDRGQHPGFKTVITQIAKGWAFKRADFEKAAEDFLAALHKSLEREGPQTFTKLGADLLENAIKSMAGDFDSENGGFGEAPKFPPHTGLNLLMDYAASSKSPDELARTALAMSLLTLEAMAMGGICDHVGGGFHRYSTDSQWVLPHFEKMLYDNALMLANYGKAALLTLDSQPEIASFYAEVTAALVAWLEREMKQENGLYASALDADSEGEEGKYYVWTESEIRQTLGDKAPAFIEAYSVLPEGNYHDEVAGALTGKNVLFSTEAQDADFEEELGALLKGRLKRPSPGLDDKQIVAWNALLISAFVTVGELEKAQEVAQAILDIEASFGRLPRQVCKGQATGEAFLDDYAALVLGLIDLALTIQMAELPGAERWQQEAVDHANRMLALFYDSEKGGFFYTTSNHDFLFGRTKPIFDQPVPSGNALAIQALIKLGDLDKARKCLESVVGWLEAAPQATQGSLQALLYYLESCEEEQPTVVAPTSAAPATSAKVEVSVAPREIHCKDGKEGKGVVRFQIPDGFHINSNQPPARWLTPTNIEIKPIKSKIEFPAAHNDQYLGDLEVPFTVQLPEKEDGADFEITVSFQTCTDSECLAPEEKRIDAVILRV